MSSIPLIGLPHKINLVRFGERDDGAGGIERGPVQLIAEKVSCRVSVLTAEDSIKLFGNASKKRWQLVVAYLVDAEFSDLVELHQASNPAPIPVGKYYRVMHVQPRFDDRGKFHHTSMFVEYEDVDTTRSTT